MDRLLRVPAHNWKRYNYTSRADEGKPLHYRPLDNIRQGDTVFLTRLWRTFRYLIRMKEDYKELLQQNCNVS